MERGRLLRLCVCVCEREAELKGGRGSKINCDISLLPVEDK